MIRVPLPSTLGGSRIHFEDSRFNISLVTATQVKSYKALADGKDVFIGTKTGSGIFAYISSITCAPCKTSSDWIRVLVAVTNFEISDKMFKLKNK
jgi:hypothetical protein